MFRDDFAANEIAHQHRHQGDGESRSGRHSVSFGIRQRREQAPFLRLQREHRKENVSNDQQREKQGGPDLNGRLRYRGPMHFGIVTFLFHLLMDGFDHDNGGVHHGADGDGDST